jgi:P-type Cu+ transporter
MTCASCVARVQKALEAQPGVATASVNLMLRNATVSFDASQTGAQHLVDAIRATGYDPFMRWAARVSIRG